MKKKPGKPGFFVRGVKGSGYWQDMSFSELLVAQLMDPFRIGLLVALVFTTLQTTAHTGRLVPLALGCIFVAVLIAMTTGTEDVDRTMAIGVGVVTNVLILAVLLGLHSVWKRVSR